MNGHIISIDVNRVTDFTRLFQEVKRTKTPRKLIQGNETIVFLMPVHYHPCYTTEKRTSEMAGVGCCKRCSCTDEDQLLIAQEAPYGGCRRASFLPHTFYYVKLDLVSNSWHSLGFYYQHVLAEDMESVLIQSSRRATIRHISRRQNSGIPLFLARHVRETEIDALIGRSAHQKRSSENHTVKIQLSIHDRPQRLCKGARYMSLYVELNSITIYLDGGILVYPDGQAGKFTETELRLFLHLLKNNRLSRSNSIPASRLARLIIPFSRYDQMEHPEQAIREYVGDMRRKLRETLYHPSYLKGSMKQGYWLNIPGSCSFSARDVQRLIDRLS